MRLLHRATTAVLIALTALGVIAQTDQPTAASNTRVERATHAGASSFVAGNFCLTRNTTEQYEAMFDSEPAGVIGADYQRATQLPNDKVLWTFQDAEVRLANGTSTLVHNIGMIQSGSCFAVFFGGTSTNPEPWLFSSETTPFFHWYWPLDATMGNDGRVYVYLAEMFERGASYLEHVEPTSTAIAAINIDNGNIEAQGPAHNDSAALYGWTSETDDDWTYLYAHCYRQFGYDPFFNGVRIHDSDCTAEVHVARVPNGAHFAQHEYWTGNGWSTRPDRAEPILETGGRLVNPADITHVDNQWLAVIKVDDWFGDKILIEASSRPTGPFETIETIYATPKCDPSVCNTYFASWIPNTTDDELTIGLSNNRWDGILSDVYRPTYQTVARPGRQHSPANRCSIGHCD